MFGLVAGSLLLVQEVTGLIPEAIFCLQRPRPSDKSKGLQDRPLARWIPRV